MKDILDQMEARERISGRQPMIQFVHHPFTRRSALSMGLAALMVPTAARSQTAGIGDPSTYPTGRLRARPGPPAAPAAPGVSDLGLDRRDARLFIPERPDPAAPAPLIVALHGAGGRGSDMMGALQSEARRHGVVVVAPTSRAATWNLDRGPVGADAAFIDRTLEAVFARVAIDPGRIAVLGFSDGGSYALSTGMVNGDLFSDVLVFAPMRFAAPVSVGRPRFFISSGRNDLTARIGDVRDIERQLQGFGYDVAFNQHSGRHLVDRQGARLAFERFLG